MNPDERFGLWIAVLVIVLGATVAVWAIYWEYRKRQLQHDERRSMIEKGMTPPPLHPAGSWRQAYPQQLRHEARLRMIEKGIPVTPMTRNLGPSKTFSVVERSCCLWEL